MTEGLALHTDDELLEMYRSAASEHRRFTVEGSVEQGNAQATLVEAVYSELRRRGPQSQSVILECLADDDLGSSLGWAGAHALEFAPDQGVRVLENLEKGDSLAALDAKVTLREWRAGRLRFP